MSSGFGWGRDRPKTSVGLAALTLAFLCWSLVSVVAAFDAQAAANRAAADQSAAVAALTNTGENLSTTFNAVASNLAAGNPFLSYGSSAPNGGNGQLAYAQREATYMLYTAAAGAAAFLLSLVPASGAAVGYRRSGGSSRAWQPASEQRLQLAGRVTTGLLSTAVRALADPVSRDRYGEEWRADLEQLAPGWRQVRWALGVRLLAVGSLNRVGRQGPSGHRVPAPPD